MIHKFKMQYAGKPLAVRDVQNDINNDSDGFFHKPENFLCFNGGVTHEFFKSYVEQEKNSTANKVNYKYLIGVTYIYFFTSLD